MILRRGEVLVHDEACGLLEESENGYRFTYDRDYVQAAHARPISVTLPLRLEPFTSPSIFPFFVGLLAEGDLAMMQCRLLQIDERDFFGRILATCEETIGAVTIRACPSIESQSIDSKSIESGS